MWHPHLKKKMVNEKEFEISPNRIVGYQNFLQLDNRENTFSSSDQISSKKMQCSCRFVKVEEALNENFGKIVKENMKTMDIQPIQSEIIKNKSLINKNRSFIKDIATGMKTNFLQKFKEVPVKNLVEEQERFRMKEQETDKLYYPAYQNPNNLKEFDSRTGDSNNSDYLKHIIPFAYTSDENKYNFSPALSPNEDLNSLLNYTRMNILIMKKIENMLINSQNAHNLNYAQNSNRITSLPFSQQSMTSATVRNQAKNFNFYPVSKAVNYPMEESVETPDLLRLASRLLDNR